MNELTDQQIEDLIDAPFVKIPDVQFYFDHKVQSPWWKFWAPVQVRCYVPLSLVRVTVYDDEIEYLTRDIQLPPESELVGAVMVFPEGYKRINLFSPTADLSQPISLTLKLQRPTNE